MTAPEIWADQGRALTVEDMEHMPDDEFRYELDDGVHSFETVFQELPPLLAVEVASPRTRLYDRNRKRDMHELARVAGDQPFQAVLPFGVEFAPSAPVRGAR